MHFKLSGKHSTLVLIWLHGQFLDLRRSRFLYKYVRNFFLNYVYGAGNIQEICAFQLCWSITVKKFAWNRKMHILWLNTFKNGNIDIIIFNKLWLILMQKGHQHVCPKNKCYAAIKKTSRERNFEHESPIYFVLMKYIIGIA